jgi:hypothetical protein
MADERKQRWALKGARTQRRNEDLHGPSIRRGAQEVENERIERGRRTLADAFDGIPAHGAFLERADLKEHSGGSARRLTCVDRAFIVPQGLDQVVDGEIIRVYWYRRNGSVGHPPKNSMVRVSAVSGAFYDIRYRETVASSMRVNLKGISHIRTCTGIFLCSIYKICNT